MFKSVDTHARIDHGKKKNVRVTFLLFEKAQLPFNTIKSSILCCIMCLTGCCWFAVRIQLQRSLLETITVHNLQAFKSAVFSRTLAGSMLPNSKFASFAQIWQFVCQRIKEQNNVWHNVLRLSAMQAKVNKYQCSSTLFSLSLSQHTTFITSYPSVWPKIRAIASTPAAKIIHFVEDLFLQRLKAENQ